MGSGVQGLGFRGLCFGFRAYEISPALEVRARAFTGLLEAFFANSLL